MAQPDQEDDFQRFHAWVKDNAIPGMTAPGAPHDRFVPLSALKDYFTRDGRKHLFALLSRIFPQPTRNSAPSADDILQKNGYLRGFATLVLIGAGQYIESFIQRDDLTDAKLPFTACPRGWPSSPYPNFFADFQKQQWVFCAAEMDFMSKKTWEKERILPITSKEKIAPNTGADTFKITIHPEYCQHLEANELVLKVFEPNLHAQKQYRNEIRAFMHLRRQPAIRKVPIPIIKFLGSYSFEHDETFNILLEYAPGGNMESMFQDATPPEGFEEILRFWERLLKLVTALKMIHYVRFEEHDDESVILGWHQDVKPENILIVNRKDMPQHEGDYKLADLGLSHFHEFVGAKRTTKSEGGTKTYSAPECYCANWLEMAQLRKVTPEVDVWSLGCTLSETAVWLKQGTAGLEAYRNERRDETNSISTFQDKEAFHDGEKVLRCVKKKHANLSEQIKQTHDAQGNIDSTTLMILEFVNLYMLKPVKTRKSAQSIWQQLNAELPSVQAYFAPREPLKGHMPILRTSTEHCPPASMERPHTTSGSTPPRNKRATSRSISTPMLFTKEPIPADGNLSSPVKLKSKKSRRQAPPPWPKKEALEWIQDRESNSGTQQHLDQSCCQEIKNRDHFFLIDDSLSMREHWPSVQEIILILSEIIYFTRADDRIDVATVAQNEKSSFRGRKELEKFVKKCRPPTTRPGITNPGLKMKNILDDYGKKIQKHPSKQFFSRIGSRIGGKPLTLYVLTDGKYQGCSDLATPIRQTIELLESLDKDKYFVGIQFIYFGDDEDARTRLRALDRLKGTENLARDIVDEEPQSGCVWKMFLGSINETYDNDNDDDNDVNDDSNDLNGAKVSADTFDDQNTPNDIANRMSTMNLNSIA